MKTTSLLVAAASFVSIAYANEPTFPCHTQVTVTQFPTRPCFLPKCPPTTTPHVCPKFIQEITVPCACPTGTVTTTRCPACTTPCPPNFKLVHPTKGCYHG